MGDSPDQKYFRRLLFESSRETWQLVVALPVYTSILGVGITGLAIYLQRKLGGMSHNQMKDALTGLVFGLGAIVIVYLFVWLFHFLCLTPKHLVGDAISKRDAALSQLESQKTTDAAKELASQQIKIMSDLWSEGKDVLENIQNTDLDLVVVKSDGQQWFDRASLWLRSNGKAGDVNYFQDCDDGRDQIPDFFPAIMEERNSLYRGIQQRIRNLRVILDREIAKRP